MSEQKEYTGILAEPLDASVDLSERPTLIREKLDALYRHYGVERKTDNITQGDLLALELAKTHIKGFQPPQKSAVGRPGKYIGQQGNKLVTDVLAKTLAGISVLKACEELCKLPNYSSTSPQSLQIRYFESMKRVFKNQTHSQVKEFTFELNKAMEENPELRRALEKLITETKPSLSV